MDLLVLNYNDAETTSQFVESMKKYLCIKKILIVDNNSSDESYNDLKKLESTKITVLKTDRNGGYGYGNNCGIKYMHDNFKSDFILLSNPDVIVEENVLIKLENFLKQNKDYAVVSPFMLTPHNEKCYNTAFKIPSKKNFILSTNWLYERTFKPLFYKDIKICLNPKKDVDAVAGSLFLMNVDYILETGLFDENIFLYWEELVLGIKIRKIQKKVALLTNLFFIHNHSVSINKSYKSEISKKKLFLNSKLYVLKKYYHANFLEYFFAYSIAKLALLDVLVIPILVKCWHKIYK